VPQLVLLQAAVDDQCPHDTPSYDPLPQPTGPQPLTGRVCWLLRPNNWLRLRLQQLLCHPWFEHSILMLIFVSSVAQALDMPSLPPSGALKRALEVLDCVFAVLFLLEAACKVRNQCCGSCVTIKALHCEGCAAQQLPARLSYEHTVRS
jgi:hypothetical protein